MNYYNHKNYFSQKRRNILIYLLSITALGCSNTKECKKAVCTMVFVSIEVQLKDSTNLNLSGITTQTVLLSSGQVIHTQTEPSSFSTGGYTVTDDSDLKELGFNANQNLELKIIKDGSLIKTVPFRIATDCCHVSKTDGPLEIQLN